MRRVLVLALLVTPLPMGLSGSSVEANGVSTPPTLTVISGPAGYTNTTADYTDTSTNDTFSDINGSIAGITAIPTDTALVDGVVAVDPPDTAAITYTRMDVGTYGTMFIGLNSSTVRFAYVVDSTAVNALTSGTATDAFIFDADGLTNTTSDRSTFTVTVNGADDTPAIGTVTSDFTEGVTENDVSYSVGSHPGAETPIKAFDDSSSTKYLNFGEGGSDLLVDVGSQYVLTAVGLTTANDSPERDPTKIRIYGSSTSFDDLVEVGSEVSLTRPSGSPTPRLSDYQNSTLSNTAAYRYYRIVFTEIADAASANSMQIAEVRLAGYAEADFPSFTPGEPATPFSRSVSLLDDNTSSVTAAITANAESGDVLACAACSANSISAAWSDPTLTLTATGSPTQANWQAAIESLTFLRTTAGATPNPDVTITANDGSTTGSAVVEISIVERTLSISASRTSIPNGGSATLSSSVSHGAGAVTFSVSSGDCTVDGVTLTADAGSGQCTIVGTIAANGGHSQVSSAPLTVTLTNRPPDISMGSTSVLAVKGVVLDAIVPTNTSDAGTWSISPALPAGLSLDTATGRITGTPTATLAATEFTLTATNSGGSDTVAFTLTIADLPAAPMELSAAAGNASATVSFTAGDDGGSAITNYEYSTDGGSTWTALDPADTESPITIAGLTNGTAASITIRALSAAGAGTASEAVSVTPIAPATTTTASTTTTTVLAPQRDGAGVLPQVTDATKGLIITDGVTSEVDVAVVEQRQLVLRGEGFEMALAGTATAGQPAMISDSGRLQIDPNGVIDVTGSGFDPESTVDVWIMSDPVYLGSVTVDADGTFAASLAVPDDLPLGNHTVQANGVTTGGVSRSLNLGIELVTHVVLPTTGSSSPIPIAALLTALGLFIAVATRRRGSMPTSA